MNQLDELDAHLVAAKDGTVVPLSSVAESAIPWELAR